MPKLSEVFVAGGEPTVTYNPRTDLQLEQKVQEYLLSKHKILSVSGSTKCGKTVLVRKVIPRDRAIWLSGGNIDSTNAFWDSILQALNGFSEFTDTLQKSNGKGSSDEVMAQVAPGGVGGSMKAASTQSHSLNLTQTSGRKTPPSVIGPQLLIKHKLPVIIDDFHYLSAELQLKIIRGLKDAVFEGVPVVLLSVPHRAYDAVRVEREMTGRVTQLEVAMWTQQELEAIASAGFRELNLSGDPGLIAQVARESFASPHLMQDFCYALCHINGITETKHTPFQIAPPQDLAAFYKGRASNAAKSAFERLQIGPRQRKDRMARTITDGSTVDIYGALLLAIAHTGPRTKLKYEEIRNSLRDILDKESVPQANEITAVLGKMSEIAKSIPGEPVLDWDKEFSTLHVSDPFFAFYLRWGTQLPAQAQKFTLAQ